MLKLLIPDMPTADDLLPYLRRIDAARIYVNHGPLVQELEARLEEMTGSPCVTVSNGTVALELALKALNIDESHDDDGICYRSYVATPALTFSATGLSVLQNRLTPLPCDSSIAWQISPDDVATSCERANLKRYSRMLEAVIPVATFGRPVPVKQWMGAPVPIIIDAAGAFPEQRVSSDPNITTCFSLHATKFVGCGEGGFVASHNKALIERVRDLSTFGENGTNAKMSEYHAAVALAALDRLPYKKLQAQRVFEWYEKHGQGLDLHGEAVGTIMNVLLPIPVTDTLVNKLLYEGIETKQWYRPYLDERVEFMDGRETICGKFPVTDHLRANLLGIPFHNFMTEADVAHVCNTLRRLIA